MEPSSSANSTMSSYIASISRREKPSSAPLRYTFSRPVSSGLKPTPSSMKGTSRPRTSVWPAVGA